MGNMTVRARLLLLVICMTVAMVIIGGVGIYTAKTQEADIADMYDHVVLPMREVARIRRLIVDNAGQIFRAFQHNPAVEYAKLHEHPVSEHLDVVSKNLKWMDETFASLRTNLLAGSEEARLMQDIEREYQAYAQSALKPTMAALTAGNYSAETVAAFLKANRAFESKFNPMMRNFAEVQEKTAKDQYEHASRESRKAIQESVVLIVLAVLGGLIMAFMTIRSITGPLNEMQQIIKQAAEQHDFTGQVHTTANDEIGQTATAFNNLLATLRRTLGEIRNGTVQLDDASAALASAASQAAIASNDTSESASAMAASVEEMSVSITSVSDSTREALAIARAAGEHSESGGAVIAGAVRDMAQIAQQVREVGGTITELGQHSDKISSVVQVIKDVADQTNLLALNAAIEAARAGEAGRGFAVVADEVRKLAERTTQATGEIGQMIAAIQDSSRTAVSAMDTTIESLQRGTEQAAKAGEAIVAIQDSNNRVVDVVKNINEAMSEQGAASQDIAQRVERVAQASEESSTSVGVSADTAKSIYQLSMGMRHNVERFKV
jgi:methyl-accepting chemotaxis protein